MSPSSISSCDSGTFSNTIELCVSSGAIESDFTFAYCSPGYSIFTSFENTLIASNGILCVLSACIGEYASLVPAVTVLSSSKNPAEASMKPSAKKMTVITTPFILNPVVVKPNLC